MIATKKTPAQLDREIAEAIANDRVAEAIANYGPWTSSYSNEDLDRTQSLAGRLTDIDRQEGRPAPAVGFSADRYKQAKRVVHDANRYSEYQQSRSKFNRS